VSSDRLDASLITPWIPRELRELLAREDGSADGVPRRSGVLGVGRPGKVGVLEAELKVDKSTGRTGLAQRFVKAPMSLTRPLYVDPSDPNHAVLYVRTTGGGLAENDRIRQKVQVGEGAQATVTTQAATNVHRMNAGLATQWSTFTVAEGASLEYVPGHTTLYGGSRLVQFNEFEVAPSAALIAGEITLSGRLAHGESHAFDAVCLGMRVTRDGMPLLNDHVVMVGAGSGTDLMLWGNAPVWGTLVVVVPEDFFSTSAPSLSDQFYEALRTIPAVQEGRVTVGVSTLINKSGVMVRIAGGSTVTVRAAMKAAHDEARRAVIGRPAFDLRTM